MRKSAASRQIRKITRKTTFILEVAINYVETYSLSNAAAQDPDKREKLSKGTHITTFNTRKDNLARTYSLKQNCKLKIS